MLVLATLEQYLHQYFKKWNSEVNFDDGNVDDLNGLVNSGGWNPAFNWGTNTQGADTLLHSMVH